MPTVRIAAEYCAEEDAEGYAPYAYFLSDDAGLEVEVDKATLDLWVSAQVIYGIVRDQMEAEYRRAAMREWTLDSQRRDV